MSGADDMIARLRGLQGVSKDLAPEIAIVVEDELRRSIAAGETPDGKKWQGKQDGGQPLMSAGHALGVAAVGGTVYVRLSGPEARHDTGRARGGIVRQVIPNSNRVPDRMAEKVRETIDVYMRRALGGS